MPKHVRVFVLLFLIAMAVCSAGAAVLKILYLDDMAEKSPVVVHATVVGARSEWNAGHNVIFTIYTARAHQYVKGFLGQTFEFRQRGGKVDHWVMDMPGSPVFQPGEEAVLFLWTDGASGAYQCIGFEQGVLRVHEEEGVKVVNRSIPVRGEAGVQASSLVRGPQVLGTSRNLRTLLAEVAAAVVRVEVAAAAARKEGR